MTRLILACLANLFMASLVLAQESDRFLWLEEINGVRPIEWVKQQNAQTTKELEAVAEYQPIRSRIQAILDSKERIPYFTFQGQDVYNFWKDPEHERGIWRRTTLESYRTQNP